MSGQSHPEHGLQNTPLAVEASPKFITFVPIPLGLMIKSQPQKVLFQPLLDARRNA